MSDLAGAAPGASTPAGQEPEAVSASPHDESLAHQKIDDLQGSVDALIEDWRTDDYAWWIGSDEGKMALPLLYQIGGLIGEFRQRAGRQNPEAYVPALPEGAIEASPSQIAQAHHEAREEAERARVLHARARRQAKHVTPEADDTHMHTPAGTPHPDDPQHRPPTPADEATAKRLAEEERERVERALQEEREHKQAEAAAAEPAPAPRDDEGKTPS